MKSQVNPVVAVVVIVAVVGGALGTMFYFADRKPPHLPTGMGAAMSTSKGKGTASTPAGAATVPAKP